MDNRNFFDEGRMIYMGKVYDLGSIEWNQHPSFKGVFLKHIIKGMETGNRMSCHLVKIEPLCELGSHIHEGKMELHEVISGSGSFTIEEEIFDYSPGVVSYIPDDIKHSIKAGNDGLQFFAKFSPPLI